MGTGTQNMPQNRSVCNQNRPVNCTAISDRNIWWALVHSVSRLPILSIKNLKLRRHNKFTIFAYILRVGQFCTN